MVRVVYNGCFGGFSFSDEVVRWVRENKENLLKEYSEEDVEDIAECPVEGEMYSDGSGPKSFDHVNGYEIERTNELLADIVEGETAFNRQIEGLSSDLDVATVPDDVEWVVDNYDGKETIREKSRTFS